MTARGTAGPAARGRDYGLGRFGLLVPGLGAPTCLAVPLSSQSVLLAPL
jgi:hypothetical protein